MRMLFNIFQGEVINDFAFFLFTTKQNHHTPMLTQQKREAPSGVFPLLFEASRYLIRR
jgi:hypothetical protein